MRQHMTAPVVLGVDGTNGSLGALRYAVQQAHAHRCQLKVVHVGLRYDPTFSVMPHSPRDVDVAGRAILAHAEGTVSQINPEVEVMTSLRHGPRFAELIDCASTARLLVLGHETQRGFDRLVFGATTAAVAARATAPTAIVPSDWKPSPATGPVVVGLGSSAHSEVLFEAAFGIAAVEEVGVEVIHAWRAPDAYIDRLYWRSHASELVTTGTELVEKEIAQWRTRYPHVPVSVRILHEWPSRALVSAGQAATVMVLLRQPAHPLLGAHLGSTARAVIGAATCVVYVVPFDPTSQSTVGLELERSGAVLR